MTSLAQRSSGLVQRRTEASRSAADKEREVGREEQEPRRGEELDHDDSRDSKETRLTLMEEVLLLGLKDREVRADRTPDLTPDMFTLFELQLMLARLPQVTALAVS